MSYDLVTRMREAAGGKPAMQWQQTYLEAADRIEMLGAEIERLRADLLEAHRALVETPSLLLRRADERANHFALL